MKKKRNTTSRLRDLLAILICLSIATYSLWLFWQDFNAVMEKNNELPIASVSWKYKAAQRKFSDRLIWDRLQQDSPVYNGDTIRTAAGAETTVTFANSELHLGENTIIQIQMDDTGTTSVNLNDGSLSANSNAGSKMQLKSGNVMVELQEGSSLNARAGRSESEALSLQVIEGNVIINGAEGSRSILQGESMSIDQNGTVGNARPVTVLEPAPNLQLLKFEGNTLPLQFTWKLDTLPQNSQLIFETATDKNFSQIQEQIGLSGLNSMKIDFTEGIHYWRFYVAIDGVPLEESQETGRINILHAPTPSPVVPLDADNFTYRTKLPTVRFMWNGNEYATSYLFEVADNLQMNNPVVSQTTQRPSSIISTLSAGTWYWRVTPYYTINGRGYGKTSQVQYFTIVQQGQLNPPQQLAPASGELVNISNSQGGQGSLFSWKREPEAQEYIVRLSRSETMASIEESITTTNNYTPLQPPAMGEWYWDVVQVDAEGNKSSASTVRSFRAVDKEIIFTPLFPPEKYHIANTRITDIRFTWKNNLEDTILFQISNSPNFDTIAYETSYTSDTVSGYASRLAEGTWYWRLKSGHGETAIITPPKEFQVVPQLPKAAILSPLSGSTIISRPESTMTLQWSPVPGADYYQVLVYHVDKAEPVAEDLFSEDTEMDISFDKYPEGSYYWTIQAFADETPMSTRITGLLTESSFTVKKIYPVNLQNPRHRAEYDGLQAYLKPDTLTFSSRSNIENYEIFIVKDTAKNKLPVEFGTPVTIPEQDLVYRGKRRQLPPLGAGTYWWTVTATTEGTHDISNTSPRYFTIHPVPPYPPVQGMDPQDGSVFDENYLSTSTDLQLSWEAIEDAEAYQLILFNNDTNQEVMNIIVPAMPNQSIINYTLDLTKYGVAHYTWTIKARKYLPTTKPRNWIADIVLKDGEKATSDFVVSLPAVEIETYETGDLYGH